MTLTFRTGQPRWMDLASSNLDSSVKFYTGLLGWTTETTATDYGDYVTFLSDGDSVGGVMAQPADSGVDDSWTVYLEVSDARATAEAAAAHGGRLLEFDEITGVGTWLTLTDATGARVGGWHNVAHSGFEATDRAGTPVWAELHARDYAKAVAFYESVFGWQTEVMSDTDDFRYTTLGASPNAVSGIWDASGDLAEIESSFWDVYLGVKNANESAVRITELGGAVLERVTDSPFGRMAHAVDSTGAGFAIIQVD